MAGMAHADQEKIAFLPKSRGNGRDLPLAPMKPKVGVTTSPRAPEGPLLEAVERAYLDAVIQAGGLPILLPVLDPADAEQLVDTVDGLLLTGGGDVNPAAYGASPHPSVYGIDDRRDAWELALARAALAADRPLLGICRGSQVLNVALGGSLVQHLPDVTELAHRVPERHDQAVHPVEIEPASRLAAVVGATTLGVNTLHHQAVGIVGQSLVVVATAADGTIEAVEGDHGHRVLGVQWHPELLAATAEHAALFRWLVAESAGSSLEAADVA
jgi:putative glutamine amidotransferase